MASTKQAVIKKKAEWIKNIAQKEKLRYFIVYITKTDQDFKEKNLTKYAPDSFYISPIKQVALYQTSSSEKKRLGRQKTLDKRYS